MMNGVFLLLMLLPLDAAALAAERSPEELVQARCSVCHGRALPDLVESCARWRGGEGLDAFLARHHARDPAERAAIVSVLRACGPNQPRGGR